MLTALIVLLVAIPLIVLSLSDGRKFIYLVLVLAGIPMSMLAPGNLLLGPFGAVSPQAALLLAILVGLIIATILAPNAFFTVFRTFPALVTFLVYAAASIAWSVDVVEGIRLFTKLLAPLLMTAVVAHYLNDAGSTRHAGTSAIVCCSVVTAVAVLNQLTHGALGGGPNEWTTQGILTAPWMSPANFSFLMGVGALTCLARFLHERSWGSLALALLFIGAVLLAFTRISMAGILIAICLLVYLMVRSLLFRVLAPISLLAVAVIGALGSEHFRNRMFFDPGHSIASLALGDTASFLSNLDTSGRSSLWQGALEFFASRNHIFGAGLGSTDHWLTRYTDANALHSEYLRIYIDTGLVGLVLFVAAMLQILWFLLRKRTGPADRWSPVVPEAALGSALFVFFAITLVTDNSLNYVSEFGLYVFAAIGGVLVADRLAGRRAQASAAVVRTSSVVRPRVLNLLDGAAGSPRVTLQGRSHVENKRS